MTYFGSGVQFPTTSSGKTFEKCCTDKAGNTYCSKKTYYVKHSHADKSCGVKTYKECRAAACGVSSYNSCRSSAGGVDYYVWHCCSNLSGNTCFTKNSLNHPYGGRGYCGKQSTVYKSCRTSACGVEEYKTCYHYRPCDKYS